MLESLKGTMTVNDLFCIFLGLMFFIVMMFAIVEYNVEIIKRKIRAKRSRKATIK